MNRIKVETVVGLFVLVGLVSFAFLAVKLGGIGDASGSHYTADRPLPLCFWIEKRGGGRDGRCRGRQGNRHPLQP